MRTLSHIHGPHHCPPDSSTCNVQGLMPYSSATGISIPRSDTLRTLSMVPKTRFKHPPTTLCHLEPVAHSSVLSGPTPRKPKIKEPDMFSGHDPSKLYRFLAHCKMAFRLQPLQFTLESTHIIWAGSYLTDMVRQWFQCLIMEPEEPLALSSWALFEEELHTYFEDPDKVATQEHKLHALKMNDNHRVLCYINQFKEVASLTKWNDNALCSQFYQGLLSHLQDDISQDGKPAKLQGMYQATLKFDGHYWECQEELKAMRTSDCGAQASSSCGTNPSSSSTPPSSSTNPPCNPKIYKPTRGLTDKEKEWCKHERLCTYCAKSDHVVDNCPSHHTL
jgi:Retrotransposon gag protein